VSFCGDDQLLASCRCCCCLLLQFMAKFFSGLAQCDICDDGQLLLSCRCCCCLWPSRKVALKVWSHHHLVTVAAAVHGQVLQWPCAVWRLGVL
jgi:hypothetical protein